MKLTAKCTICACFLAPLFLIGGASASSPAWSSIASLPSAIGNAAAVSAACAGSTSSRCVYSIGGSTESVNGLRALYMYNPQTKQWKGEASMSTGRSQLGAASGPCPNDLGQTCVYAIGGTAATGAFLSSVEIYNPYTNRWSFAPPVPTPYASPSFPGRSQLAASNGPCFTALTRTCVYAIAGYNMSLYALSSVEMFDPATGHWTAAASLRTARSRVAAASAPCRGSLAQACIYAVGGTGDSGFLGSVEMYQPSTNTWSAVAELHAKSSSASLDVAGADASPALCVTQTTRLCLYAYGGQDQNFNILNAAMMYDPRLNVWTYVAPMTTSRDNFGGASAPCVQGLPTSCLFALGGSARSYIQRAETLTP